MKRIISFFSAIAVVSLFLNGCGDSINSNFNELAKQAIKDNKSLIQFYDFKNRVNYNYTYLNQNQLPLDQLLNNLLEMTKDCSKNETEIKEAINSDTTLTFNCITKLTEQQKNNMKQMDNSIDTENVQMQIKIIGKNAKDEDLFIEADKINSSYTLIAFNKHQLHNITVTNFTKELENSIFPLIKSRCNVEQKDVEGSKIGTYEDCVISNSRIFITGM